MSMPPQAESEFSYPIVPSELGDEAVTLELGPDAAARAALAARFGLVDLIAFSATVRAGWAHGGRLFKLAGQIRAELVQTCVVTQEPVRGRIDEPFEIFYRPGGVDPEDRDGTEAADAEPLSSDSLDVGEAVAAELALAIDPYPRKPGVGYETGPSAPENGPLRDHGAGPQGGAAKPFEGLAALRGNK